MRYIASVLFAVALPVLASAEELRIGWIGPLTGPSAVLGKDALQAVAMVFDAANVERGRSGGVVFRLIAEDDSYATAKTVAAYNKLVHTDKVSIILAYTYSGLFAIADKAQRDGILIIDPLDCDEDIGKLPQNTICIAKLTEDFGKALAAVMLKRNNLPCAMLYFESDAFPVKVASSTRDELRKHGTQLAFFDGYASSTSDFRSSLTKAKQRGVRCLGIWGYDEVGVALKQARSLGLTADFYTLTTVLSPTVQAVAEGATEGVLCPVWSAQRNEKYAEFLTRFEARTGAKPVLEVSTVPSYDVANLLVDATTAHLQQGHAPSADTVRDFFYEIRNYNGASGTITVDPTGVVRTLNVWVGKIHKGDIVLEKGSGVFLKN